MFATIATRTHFLLESAWQGFILPLLSGQILPVAILASVAPATANARLIENVASYSSEQSVGASAPSAHSFDDRILPSLLLEDSRTFVDRTHEYNGITSAGIPSVFLGAEYIRNANNHKDSPDFRLEFDLTEPADLYLIVDERIGAEMFLAARPWAAAIGFVGTELRIGIDEGPPFQELAVGPAQSINSTSVALVLQHAPTGHYRMFEQNFTTGNTSGSNMYGVVAVPVPEPTSWLLALLCLALVNTITRRRTTLAITSLLRHRRNCSVSAQTTFLVPLLTLLTSAMCGATTVSYDAASGLLPQSVGWTFTDQNNPASTVILGGGTMTHDSKFSNRAFWEIDLDALNGTSGEAGVFMERTVRIVSEFSTTTPSGHPRGAELLTAGAANAITGSVVILAGNEDRVFLRDDATEAVLASISMDTTDDFHTYRMEILQQNVWLFIDGQLKANVATSLFPAPTFDIGGKFGDGSEYSESVTQTTSVVIGSLADVGGPTVPEPSALLLALVGTAAVYAGQIFRRKTMSYRQNGVNRCG